MGLAVRQRRRHSSRHSKRPPPLHQQRSHSSRRHATIDKLAESVPAGMMSAAVNAALIGKSVRDIGEHSTLGNDEFTRGVEHIAWHLCKLTQRTYSGRAELTAQTSRLGGSDAPRRVPRSDADALRDRQHVRLREPRGAIREADCERSVRQVPDAAREREGMMEVAIPGAGWLSLKVAKRAGLI